MYTGKHDVIFVGAYVTQMQKLSRLQPRDDVLLGASHEQALEKSCLVHDPFKLRAVLNHYKSHDGVNPSYIHDLCACQFHVMCDVIEDEV